MTYTVPKPAESTLLGTLRTLDKTDCMQSYKENLNKYKNNKIVQDRFFDKSTIS